MRRSVILPARSATWARGRPAGGDSVPPQGLVLGFDLEITSDQIDSDMPEKRILGAQYSLQVRKAVARKESSQTLLERGRNHPAYQPVVRRVSLYRANFAFAPLPPSHGPTTLPRVWLRAVAPPARPSAPSSNRNSGSMCFSAPAEEELSSGMVWQALLWAAARISLSGDTVR
jgi:hypothetical protein